MIRKPFPDSQRVPVAFLIFVLLAGIPSFAAPYLQPRSPDGVALLPGPPVDGSVEAAADLETVRAVVKARTDAEKAKASKDSTLAFSLFDGAIGHPLSPEKLPKTLALLEEVKKEIGEHIDFPKNHFKRRRPYQLDETLATGKPEPSFSYPSGHSTRGTVYAMVLAEIFPARKDALLQIGRDIGWDRVILAKHFPTDIYAGRVLGQ